MFRIWSGYCGKKAIILRTWVGILCVQTSPQTRWSELCIVASYGQLIFVHCLSAVHPQRHTLPNLSCLPLREHYLYPISTAPINTLTNTI